MSAETIKSHDETPENYIDRTKRKRLQNKRKRVYNSIQEYENETNMAGYEASQDRYPIEEE